MNDEEISNLMKNLGLQMDKEELKAKIQASYVAKPSKTKKSSEKKVALETEASNHAIDDEAN